MSIFNEIARNELRHRIQAKASIAIRDGMVVLDNAGNPAEVTGYWYRPETDPDLRTHAGLPNNDTDNPEDPPPPPPSRFGWRRFLPHLRRLLEVIGHPIHQHDTPHRSGAILIG